MENLPIIEEKWNVGRKKRCKEPAYNQEKVEYRQEEKA